MRQSSTEFTGAVTLAADPTSALEAATKQYALAVAASAAAAAVAGDGIHVLKAGDSLTGVLAMAVANGVNAIAVTPGTGATTQNGYYMMNARARFGYDGTYVTIDDNGASKGTQIKVGGIQKVLIDSNQIALLSGLKVNRKTVSDAAYTAATGDHIIAYTSLTAARAVTLPSAATAGAGAELIIKDETGNAGTNNITVTGTIDGATNKVINAAYGVVRVYSNGSNWFTY